MENLDRTALGADTRQQLADLAALGIDWDEPVIYQTDRLDMYRSVIAELTDAGETFECFCTRREILRHRRRRTPRRRLPRNMPRTDHRPAGEKIAAGRPPAIRLRSAITEFTVIDTPARRIHLAWSTISSSAGRRYACLQPRAVVVDD